MPKDALPRSPSPGGSRPAAPFEPASAIAEVAADLRLLSDDSISTLSERERLVLGRALLELEGLPSTAPARGWSTPETPVGAEQLRSLVQCLSRVISGSSQLQVTLILLRARDLVEEAAALGEPA